MEKITSRFLRKKFLKFFENRGHAVIKSASLIPENDPSVRYAPAHSLSFGTEPSFGYAACRRSEVRKDG